MHIKDSIEQNGFVLISEEKQIRTRLTKFPVLDLKDEYRNCL
jgi:hypothetical protein